jgi:hypothetical protein
MAVVLELSGRCAERFAADTFGQAAAVYSDWDIAGENIRMLLRFIRYSQEPSRGT